ncbi:MAG: endonuclease domain-containing protein, partial [Sulfurimicrobium sp.]|nr:endonuclease domain-containing protein [Sulfurimicrobium sp.]
MGTLLAGDKGGSRRVKPFLPYNKNLTTLARENRKNPTPVETRLWHEVLRMRQFAQHKFLRQKPIGNFIVDFYCAELRLVIEVDGHDHAEKAGDDLERSRFLNELGLTVIRYGNNEILGNIEGVYEDLVVRIQNLTPLDPPLSGGKAPTPPGLTFSPPRSALSESGSKAARSGETGGKRDTPPGLPTPPSLPLSGEGQTGEERSASPLTRGDRGGLENLENTP